MLFKHVVPNLDIFSPTVRTYLVRYAVTAYRYFQSIWNGTGASGRSPVTFGTTTAVMLFLLDPTGEIWKGNTTDARYSNVLIEARRDRL